MEWCATCDRPLATPALEAHVDGCACTECVAACWKEYGGDCEPDHELATALTRILAAEQRAERLTVALRSARLFLAQRDDCKKPYTQIGQIVADIDAALVEKDVP